MDRHETRWNSPAPTTAATLGGMNPAGDGRSFDELVGEAERAPIDGWDFGWLDGRAIEERPSWHYFDLVAERASAVGSLLDVQVGSGGMIAALPAVPVLTVG